MKIKFVDLKKQYISIKYEIDTAISEVIENTAFIRGENVDTFENNFSKLYDNFECVSCANGTDAIYIALKALGIKPGDEVIVPAHTWISTSETVTQAGGKVVFCDIDSESYTINTQNIEGLITNKTVGIIPVHLYGNAADMENISDIALRNNLWVIEDCAQAHLTTFKDRLVGTFGDIATFSFYPGKNLGAYGDAGCVLTGNVKLANYMKMYARHGGLTKGEHVIEGINSRMDGIQAAVLNVKLKYLEKWTEMRRSVAAKYLQELADIPSIKLPAISSSTNSSWHLFVIYSDRRDELKKFLSERGVETVINYPTSLPFLEAYAYLGHSSVDFPVAHEHQGKILSLPVYPELKDAEISYIASQIREFYKK
ncbi:DegT/DnrJ/EryC1/StrS family aminotransferase [Gammaproteobacteria bacterium]|nr:DegT/DnrJ/EryC1/StrS family aminotransferase [Gammaproteobacteria bacterium]